MPRYTVPNKSGTYQVKSTNNEIAAHALAISPVEPKSTLSGQITIRTRAPGSTVFESVPKGSLDLDALTTLTFTFAVAEYMFIVNNMGGTAANIEIQDTIKEL